MTCPSGKRTWKKRGGAHREAKRLTRLSRENPVRSLRAGCEVLEYRCADCGGWHVMTDKDSARQERRLRSLRGEGSA